MRIAFFGYSQIGVRALKTLFHIGEPVAAVFTHEDDAGEQIWFDSVASVAQSRGIPLHKISPANPRGPVPYKPLVEAARPDLILSASFRALIPEDVLRIPAKGSLNLHGSLLPRYRGRAPLNWALVHGEAATGMTLHYMTAAPDAGDIVGQIRIPIGADETAPELQTRLENAVEELLKKYIPLLASGTAPRIPQDASKSSYFGRRRPEDGRFEWSWPARRIHNLVRAVTRPFPGAFTEDPASAGGQKGIIKVWKTRVLENWSGAPLRPGEITGASSRDARTVAGTGDGVLELLDWEKAQKT